MAELLPSDIQVLESQLSAWEGLMNSIDNSRLRRECEQAMFYTKRSIIMSTPPTRVFLPPGWQYANDPQVSPEISDNQVHFTKPGLNPQVKCL